MADTDRKSRSRSAEQNSSAVADPAQQAQILRQLLNNRCQLGIKVPGSENIFASTILSVNRDENSLELDELTPEPGHLLAASGQQLEVSATLLGVLVGFSVRIMHIGQEGGNWVYVAHFPKELIYEQQREYYRIYAGMMARPTIEIRMDEQTIVKGELANISLGGALAQLPPQLDLAIGDQQRGCKIIFARNEVFEVDVEIRHLQPDPKTRAVKAGVLFVDLDQQQLRALQKHTANIERQNMRA